MRILFIEDSARLQSSVSRGLRKAGYVVDGTGDGKEGLFLAESSEYDVIILDLMLPGLDGLSLLRRLRTVGGVHTCSFSRPGTPLKTVCAAYRPVPTIT